MGKILTYILIAAILTILGLSISVSKLRGEKERYEANQKTLLGKVEYYKTRSGTNAASVQKLTLSYNELKENYAEVCKTAKDLNIQVKRLQSVSNTSTKTEVQINTVVKDSIVYIKGDPVNVTAFRWEDPWTGIQGVIRNDSIDLNVQSCDTLVQIVHKVPHKFWFIKWGCKAIRQEIVSKNPHTHITYTDYIELKK